MRHDDVPQTIIELIAKKQWGFGQKVLDALNACEFTRDDLRQCVLDGRLDKSERDETGEAADGRKYVIHGRAGGGYPFYVCGKILCDDEGRYFFFITAHRRDR